MVASSVAHRLTVLAAVQHFWDENGFPPSLRELQAVLGYASPSSVHAQLGRLQADGWVQWRQGKVRTLTVTAAGRRAIVDA